MDKLLELLDKNWAVVSAAPLAVGALAVAMFSLAYVAAKWRYVGTISNMQSLIDTLRERLVARTELAESFKERALKFDEKAEAVAEASEIELREKTLALVTQVRSFVETSTQTDRHLSDSRMVEMRRAATEEQRQAIWDGNWSETNRLSSQRNAEYDRRFKIDAMLLRDELRSRLPGYTADMMAEHSYEHPANPFGITAVADDLEKMAKSLKA
jgi:hypothetical protein